MKSYCPDVNVWIALAFDGHKHHRAAIAWFDRLHGEAVYFCRLTQLGLLRLLTVQSVMQREVRSQAEAWRIYDSLLCDPYISFQSEVDAEQVNTVLRRLTSGSRPLWQQWTHAYLAAFARVAGLTVVTFDRGLYKLTSDNTVLLS
jgi:toxin-antitoxin system PIN domain toxin